MIRMLCECHGFGAHHGQTETQSRVAPEACEQLVHGRVERCALAPQQVRDHVKGGDRTHFARRLMEEAGWYATSR